MATHLKVPILDLAPEIESQWNELNEAIQAVLRSGHFIMGPSVKAFEEETASYLGVKYAIGVNSGTDALIIGLEALGIKPGDEVITTSFTFFATAEAISHHGATPVFVDIDPNTLNLDVGKLEEKITGKTRAVIPVHLFGHAVDMGAMVDLSLKHGFQILEDVAQAFGGEYRGKKLGAIGQVGAFSFFPSKNLGAFGDAGLIATSDERVAEKARMLRTHGSRRKYYNEMIGYNSRLDEIQAAILRVKLRYLEKANEGRRAAAARYDELFKGLPLVKTPVQKEYAKHVFHQYTLQIGCEKRDHVQAALAEHGIGTMIYYPVPVHQLPVYSGSQPSLPVTEQACREVLSLPIWPSISAETQRELAAVIRNTF